MRGPRPVHALHEQGAEELGLHGFAPRHDADEAERDGDIDGCYGQDRVEHRPRDGPSRIADLSAEVTDLVVAKKQVEHLGRALAEAGKESEVEAERVLGQVECQSWVEVQDSRDDDPARGQQHHRPQSEHQLGDVVDAPVQRDDQQGADACCQQLAVELGQIGQEHSQVLDKADVAAGDLERPGEKDLPDEEEGQHPAPRARAEALPQEHVGAAGGGFRRAELGHDHAVGQRDDGPDHPSEIRLRACEGLQDQGDRDERPDPDHVGHVDRGRIQQSQPAMHLCHVGNGSWRLGQGSTSLETRLA